MQNIDYNLSWSVIFSGLHRTFPNATASRASNIFPIGCSCKHTLEMVHEDLARAFKSMLRGDINDRTLERKQQ
jgi:hypothetical protein